ncbi:DUF11 domain-containing protein [Embleya hyalina]|uniref:Uncharacterized protein n=1 Tax=Embleya hyalina TaxID=516124 RepID=A0A401YGL2_9ACTN|nr:DUF11 domain-containing protein [Embleya hyalina]GCD93751.1 hypothetical protein EHYA_01399 [Embleya hyalina]
MAQQHAQFPIVESFTEDIPTNPHWQLLGSATLNGSLELTPNAQAKAGTAFLDQPFSSTLGVTIDFDYSCEGGGGSGFGDGFSVYLIDGAHTTAPGGRGGALGYSTTKSGSTIVADGVTAGYVGIGFDNFGNFSAPAAGPDGPGPQPNTVGVRGSGNLKQGFHWLVGEQVEGGFRGGWEKGAHIQVSVIAGRLTVRVADRANPNGTLVIGDFDLVDAPGQVPVPDTFKLGFAAGTGGAIAAHRIRDLVVALPVNMPLEMSGPLTAESGDRIAYDIGVQNLGPNDAPDAVVEAEFPPELTDVELSARGENGAFCGTGSVRDGLRLPIDLPVGGKAMIGLTGAIAGDFQGRLTTSSRITSPTRANTAEQYSDSVDTEVEPPRVGIEYEQLPGFGQTYPEDAKGWVIPYDLTLVANEDRVLRWEVFFEIPPGVGRINPIQQYWFTVTEDGGEGSVILTSPDSGHTIEPGDPLTFRVQVLYKSQFDAGDGVLRNVRATEVTRP